MPVHVGYTAIPLNNKQEEETTADNDNDAKPAGNDDATNEKPLHASCRKRCHNFTKNVMAHEFLSYRRIDRFYHRGTLLFDNDNALLPQ